MNLRLFRSFLVLSLLAPMALAHPGHDVLSHGVEHVARSPYHVAVLLFVSLVAMTFGFMVQNARARNALRVTAVATAAVALLVAIRF